MRYAVHRRPLLIEMARHLPGTVKNPGPGTRKNKKAAAAAVAAGAALPAAGLVQAPPKSPKVQAKGHIPGGGPAKRKWQELYAKVISDLPEKERSAGGMSLASWEDYLTKGMSSLKSTDPRAIRALAKKSEQLKMIDAERAKRTDILRDPKVLYHAKMPILNKIYHAAKTPDVAKGLAGEFLRQHRTGAIVGGVGLGLLGAHWLKKKLRGTGTHTGQFYGYHPPEIQPDPGEEVYPSMSDGGNMAFAQGSAYAPLHGGLY